MWPQHPTEVEIYEEFRLDSLYINEWIEAATIKKSPYLSDDDFHQAAEELKVDEATIHAVVDIEAGAKHSGFYQEGKPVINFSLELFRKYAKQRGINLANYTKKYPQIFSSPNRAKYGGYLPAQQARLDAAMAIDSIAAIEATYWGMFQIGGFNWRKCGVDSPQEFAHRMSSSEHDQLELFVNFLQNTGLDLPLQRRDWSNFARGYNGASYAKRGYHTRLKKAYDKYR